MKANDKRGSPGKQRAAEAAVAGTKGASTRTETTDASAMDTKAAGTGAADAELVGMDADGYRALMRHQAGAVTVIATGSGDSRAGLTATAVASLSDHPPTILACVQRKASAHDIIVESGVFSVNLLTDRQQDIAEVFAGRSDLKGSARFARGAWETLVSGAPVLAAALAVLDCRLVDRHDFTTHSIFIGRVLAGRFDEKAAPLLYFRNDFWDFGLR